MDFPELPVMTRKELEEEESRAWAQWVDAKGSLREPMFADSFARLHLRTRIINALAGAPVIRTRKSSPWLVDNMIGCGHRLVMIDHLGKMISVPMHESDIKDYQKFKKALTMNIDHFDSDKHFAWHHWHAAR